MKYFKKLLLLSSEGFLALNLDLLKLSAGIQALNSSSTLTCFFSGHFYRFLRRALKLTLKLFKPPLQLVVVEGSLARESRVGAGPPDGAEAGARTPAGAGVRRAGASQGRRQGVGVVHGWGERAGGKRTRETGGGALKLHDEDLEETSPQRHRGETPRRNVSV